MMATRLKIFVAVFCVLVTAQVFGQGAGNQLVTRTFKVDIEAFSERLKTRGEEILRRQFATVGIVFPESSLAVTTTPTEKGMFLNERKGELIVRATREELGQIEKIIAGMQKGPPIVQIETTFVEAPTVNRPIPLRPLPNGLTNVWIITEKQYREAVRTYENSRGVDVLTAPAIVTMSGRQARLGVERPKPVNYQDPPELPRDTSPDADPTPRNRRRLPLPPGFQPTERF